MNPFLKQLAQWCLFRFPGDMSQLTLVLPNKRAGLFFRKYLSGLINKPLWAPRVVEISTFVRELSGLEQPDKYYQSVMLYKSYREILLKKKINPEDYSAFYPWGKIILSDFSEIDKNLLNAKDVFKTIKDLRELEDYFDYLTEEQLEALRLFWSHIDTSSVSEEKDNFLRTWAILFDVYSSFRAELLAKGFGYDGLIYRTVNNKIQNNELKLDGRIYLFAGFNYLTRSEEGIFDFFMTHTDSYFFWDMSPELISRPDFKPAEKIKEYTARFEMPDDFSPVYNPLAQTHFTLTAVPGKSSQCKVLGEKLEAIQTDTSSEDDFDKNLVVLADENLLFPMLYSVPDKFEKVNITMGYPLMQSRLAGFVSTLSDLLKRARRSGKGDVFFYYKNVIALLSSPFAGTDNDKVQALIGHIQEYNLVSVPAALLAESGTIPAKCAHLPGEGDYFDYFLGILRELIAGSLEDEKTLDKEFAWQFYKEINRLKEVCEVENLVLEKDIFFNLLREITGTASIAFEGEPLGGLQLMGVLETRCLNFENVFILSMNEGIFPSVNRASSFIPYSVRRAFNLPTYDQEDVIFAYYFYRLLPGAKHVHLFYNTGKSDREGEMSRYLMQLQYDFKLDLHKQVTGNELAAGKVQPISIPKSTDILHVLDDYLEPGRKAFSPTALNTWLDCRLKFYFRYVLGLFEKEEVLEDMDAATLGLILHTAMEKLYSRFEREKELLPADIDTLFPLVPDAVSRAFEDLHVVEPSGNNHGIRTIVKSVVEKYIVQILKFDKGNCPFRIISLEHRAEDAYHFQFGQSERAQTARLKGIIDRVDKKQECIRIIDYKTGSDRLDFESVSSLFDRENKKRNKAVFQLLYYSMNYLMDRPDNLAVTPLLYVVKDMYHNDFKGQILLKPDRKRMEVHDARELLPEFREHLKLMLTEIFNPDIPFDQTTLPDHCKYCPYAGICGKEAE